MIKFTKAPFEDEMNVNLWPRWHAKYCDIFKIIPLKNPVINQIIKHAPIVGDRKKVLIDVRTQFLEVGFHSTTPGWHRDTIEDPRALHHLYVLGEHRTEFEIDGVIKPIPKGYYATYDRHAYHRGLVVRKPEFRLFVRIEELDFFLSEGKYTPLQNYYAAKYPIGENTQFIHDDEYYQTFIDQYELNTGAPDE